MKDDLDLRFAASEKYWKDFVEACALRWGLCPDKPAVLRAVQDREDLAIAVWGSLGQSYAEWLNAPSASISGQRPIELVQSATTKDTVRFRSLVMQLP